MEAKESYFRQALADAQVDVSINTTAIGVVVPKWLYDSPNVLLQIGLNQPKPIHDLEINGQGIRCTLSFNNSPFRVSIPWHSVWLMRPTHDHTTGALFPEALGSMPEPQLSATGTDAPQMATVRQTSTAPKLKRKLPEGWRVMDGGGTNTSADNGPTAA